MLKLYEITADVRTLLETGIDEETGEMSPELVNALAVFDGKGAAVAAYVLNVEAEAEAVNATIRRLMTRKRSLEARSDKMREYLMRNMIAAGIKKIRANDGSFTATLYPQRDESVVIDEAAVLPPTLTRTKVEPDKTAIKRAILAGEPVPAGVEIVRRDRLTIA